MQGRPGGGYEPGDRPSARRIASSNGTGKQPAIPQRPPGMARVNRPSTIPRVARPQRKAAEPGKSRRGLLIVAGVLAIVAVFVCIGSYALYNLFNGISASAGAATTAGSFLTALSSHNYDQAYQSLGPAITLSMQKDQFTQQAQSLDRCYGVVKNYTEIQGSATTQNNNQSYSYTITREKLAHTYVMRLTVQQDQYDPNTWKITDYGGNLGPGSSAPACK
ncbi:MAG: hypothetical protein H0V70_19740 [Ktedonobacteraceae bacterium]|nr:hypothetical protein [Ktedonobacteraceae bacterium]